MGKIIEALTEFNVSDDSFVMLFCVDRADVWHITDDYIQEALVQTSTAGMLSALLSDKNITVLSRWDEDILQEMRANGLLEDYDHEDWFEDYLTETIEREAYEYDLLGISTEKYDHKRGTCEISATVKVPVKEVKTFSEDVDVLFSGWEVSIQTKNGILTLDS